jgi:hypothetical protein
MGEILYEWVDVGGFRHQNHAPYSRSQCTAQPASLRSGGRCSGSGAPVALAAPPPWVAGLRIALVIDYMHSSQAWLGISGPSSIMGSILNCVWLCVHHAAAGKACSELASSIYCCVRARAAPPTATQ